MKKSQVVFPLFCVLLLATICLRYSIFISFIQSHKDTFRAELHGPTAKITLFTMDAATFENGSQVCEWKDGRREMVINGIAFDVKSWRRVGSYFVVELIEDHKENRLIANYFSTEKQDNSLLQLVFQFWYLEVNAPVNMDLFAGNLHIYSGYFFSETHPAREVPARPPLSS